MTKTITPEQLKQLLQTARGALADIAHSSDMTLATARTKADRVYRDTEPGPDGWPRLSVEPRSEHGK